MKKFLSEGKERNWYLIKEWTTKVGLPARVQQCVWNEKVRKLAPSLGDSFYTGYVQKRADDTKKYYDSDTDVHGGVTFENELNGEKRIWVGFDMAHFGDEERQSEEYAIEQCEKLAEQMV